MTMTRTLTTKCSMTGLPQASAQEGRKVCQQGYYTRQSHTAYRGQLQCKA